MTFMKRSFRIVLAIGMACGVTGIYLTGPDPDTCWDCTHQVNPVLAVSIFVTTALVSLRVFKKIADMEREHGW